jgi:hypothetical protein
MPKKPTSVSELKATNRMLVDDLNFLIAGVAAADIFVPLEKVAKAAVASGLHTEAEAIAIAGRLAGYLKESVAAHREDQKRPESVIETRRILLPS